MGFKPGSLMTGSKGVDHWTSGTVYDSSEIAGSLQPSIFWLVCLRQKERERRKRERKTQRQRAFTASMLPPRIHCNDYVLVCWNIYTKMKLNPTCLVSAMTGLYPMLSKYTQVQCILPGPTSGKRCWTT